MRTRSLLFIGGVCLSSLVMAQTPRPTSIDVAKMEFRAKQIVPPSPEAAELGKYGNVPVSLFTGTPSVSVPLVELKGSMLSVPVSLSYNASGFKPSEIAPWTGLGWALNAGGVITRTAAGNPDMSANYFTTNPLTEPNPGDQLAVQGYYADIRDNIKETQPDIFYYNFMGYSGRFMIKPDGTVHKKEKDMLSFASWSVNHDNNNFVVRDDRGIQYQFTARESTHLQPMSDDPDGAGQPSFDFTSAWYLTQITSADGTEQIFFEYHSPLQAQEMFNNPLDSRSVSYSVQVGGGSYPPPPTPTVYVKTPPLSSVQKKFIKKITLQKGMAIAGYVEFESGVNERADLWNSGFDGERILKKVKLYSTYNMVNTLVQEFELGYGYFGENYSSTAGQWRLKLKTVQEKSPNTTIPHKPAYTFYYNQEDYTMPERFTAGLDHWGFYNRQTNVNGNGVTKTLVPNVVVTSSQTHAALAGTWGEGANREADEIGSKTAVLEKISYPTGGYTTFEYEGNTGMPWGGGGSIQAVGGVRVKKMTDYYGDNKKAVIKNYEYKLADGSGSGKTGPVPRYEEYTNYTTAECLQTHLSDFTVNITGNSVYGLGSVQGSHIGYERVVEYQTDLSDVPLGKTVYTYNINAFYENDDDIGNGDLVKKEIFDANGKLLQKELTTYTYSDLDNLYQIKIKPQVNQSSYTILCDNNGNIHYRTPNPCNNYNPVVCPMGINVPTQYQVYKYGMRYQQKKLVSQEQTVYDQLTNNYITTTRNFTYGNSAHTYPTLTEETTSGGEKIFTSMKYVADYVNSCGGTLTPGSFAYNIGQMQGNYMPSPVIEKLQYREDPGGGNRRYISGQITDYKLGNPVRLYFLQAKPLLTSVTASAVCGNTFTSDNNYRLAATMKYNSQQNLEEESKTGDIITSYIWGYDHRYPVAKIVGKNYADAVSQSGINLSVLNTGSESAIRTELNKLRTLSGAFVTTFTYKPSVGVISQTDPRGRVAYYEYDALNRLMLVRDHDLNIIKKICYTYSGQQEDCTDNSCPNTVANWQNTVTALRCQQVSSANTGYQEQEQRDMNTCSPTYNQTRWVLAGQNLAACPLPPACNTTNCPGPDKKCINGVCETGVLKVISTRRERAFGEPDENGNIPIYWKYFCTSAYCFSDGTTSTPVETETGGFCTVVLCQ